MVVMKPCSTVAVGRAGGVRDDPVRLRVVVVVVDAEHDRHVGIGRRSGDDHLRGARFEMPRGALAVGEEPCRLDHDVDAQIAPGQVLGIAFGEEEEIVTSDGDLAVPDLDVLGQAAQHRVVLEQVSHRLGVPEVVRSDDFEVPAPLQVSPKEVAPNTPEPVDPNLHLGHLILPTELLRM
jgi:hypothetical protein